MANHTLAQAEASKVVRCESVTSDSTHQYYVFAATDDNGEYYEWTNDTLSASASQTDIKNEFIAHLQTKEKRVPGPVIQHVPDASGVIGSTVSSL